jgi:hypothetical protein
MRANELKEILSRRPFRPIRLLITSGETVDIRHPEQAMVWGGTVAFGIGPKPDVVEHIGWYNLIHVVKVISLDAVRKRRRRKKRAI